MKELITDIKKSRLTKGFLYMSELLNGKIPFDGVIKDKDFSYFVINTYEKRISIHNLNVMSKMVTHFDYEQSKSYDIISKVIENSIYSSYKQRWI